MLWVCFLNPTDGWDSELRNCRTSTHRANNAKHVRVCSEFHSVALLYLLACVTRTRAVAHPVLTDPTANLTSGNEVTGMLSHLLSMLTVDHVSLIPKQPQASSLDVDPDQWWYRSRTEKINSWKMRERKREREREREIGGCRGRGGGGGGGSIENERNDGRKIINSLTGLDKLEVLSTTLPTASLSTRLWQDHLNTQRFLATFRRQATHHA